MFGVPSVTTFLYMNHLSKMYSSFAGQKLGSMHYQGLRQLPLNCVEYNVLYVYHAMFAYFNRDNVALKGLAK
ncbi:hypothetical protein JHK86_028072 [Glycine max]|nr:hypothetical protein JHK86_028072 [Glycine max]